MIDAQPVKWTRQSTGKTIEVDVNLEDFSTKELLQVLIDRRVISIAMAQKLAAGEPLAFTSTMSDAESMEIARAEILRGGKGEALIFLERALGFPFYGKLA